MHMDPAKRSTSFTATEGTARQMRDAFGKFATGVTLITCPSDEGPIAIVANSFSSVSLDPALVLWCLDYNSSRYRYFEAADHYAIHVLSADQKGLCEAAAKNGRALAELPHQTNADGVPLIEDCLARFECRRVAAHDAGDHVIIVGQVQRTQMCDGAPLTFCGGQFGTVTP